MSFQSFHKMYPEVALALGHSDTDVPSGSLVCVSDTLQNSGDFVLVHFLSVYLKSGWRVVLASHRHVLSHFASIVKKFNLNLSALEQSGQFKFINGLEHSIYPLPDPWTNFVSLVNDALTSVSPVTDEQPAPIEWKGTVLIWDGLSELLIQHPFEVGNAQAHALATVQQLYAQGSMVAMMHGDVEMDASLAAMLRRRSNQFVEVSALPSGQSSLVTGQLVVLSHDSNGTAVFHELKHYKITESAVRVFLPGATHT